MRSGARVWGRLVWAICLPAVAAPYAVAAPARVEVPIFQRVLSNGEIRFFVQVRVGGSGPIEAMLDTGSFGLRVLSRALPPSRYELSGIVRAYGYGSGVVLHGPLARAVVEIGAVTTGVPVGVQIVQSVDCGLRQPDCPASRVAPADYRIGGDGLRREGFDAILGVSLRGSDAPGAANNPLSAIGDRSWIIVLPKPGAAAPGQLIVNPGAADLAGFHPVRTQASPGADGRTRIADTQIPNCPYAPLEQQASCPLMPIDSGARPGVPPFWSYAVLYDVGSPGMMVRPR